MGSTAQRAEVRQRVLALARADTRVTAGAFTGSLAFDSGDAWSDIDVGHHAESCVQMSSKQGSKDAKLTISSPLHLAEGQIEALVSHPHRETSSLENIVIQEDEHTSSFPDPPFAVGCFTTHDHERSVVSRPGFWVSEYLA